MSNVINRWVTSAVAAASLLFTPAALLAQATLTSQLRTIAVGSPAGSPSSASAPDFSPFNTSVTSGFSPATNSVGISSNLSPSAISLSSSINCQTAGNVFPTSTPSGVLQHIVEFSLPTPASFILLASDNLPGGPNFALNTVLQDSFGNVIFSGRSTSPTGNTGTLAPGIYTLATISQVSTAGGAAGPVVGNLNVSLNLGVAIDTPTSFLYQGQLLNNGQPANGEFDMTFQVFNAPTGGTAITTPISIPRVRVTNGLFTTPVPVPASVWNGNRTWMEVSVAFPISLPVVLTPRQPIQPAPKALWAATADVASTAASVPWAGVAGVPANVANAFSPWFSVPSGIAYTGGSVGIGTASPASPLHIRSGASGLAPNAGSVLALEAAGSAYFNLLSPNGNESGILFGRPSAGAAGAGIIYNNASTPGGLQFRTDANTTRLTISNTGAASFASTVNAAGAVTAPNFTYSTPITSFAMFTDVHARSRNGSPVRGAGLGNGGASLDTGTVDALVIPMNLPNGATVTNLRVFVVDNSAARDLSIVFSGYSPAGSFFTLGTAATAGAGTAVQTIDIPLNVVIDNSTFGYSVLFNATSGVWDSAIQVRAVRVTYTMPRPVP